MDSARPSNSTELLSLQEAAQLLGVSVQVLLAWNEHNILKPTITLSGQIGYTEHQIQQFLSIRKAAQSHTQERKDHPASMGDWAQHTSQKSTLTSLLYPRNSLSLLIGFGTLAGIIILFLVSSSPESDLLRSSNAELAKSQRSTLALSEKTPVTTPVQLSAEAMQNKNLKLEGADSDAEKHITQEILAHKSSTNSLDKKVTHESIIAMLLGKTEDQNSEFPDNADGLSVLASTANCTDCENENTALAFDEEGNLKGEAEENTAVSTLEKISSGIGTNSPASPVTDPRIQFVFLAFGAGVLLYVFRRQLAFTFDFPGAVGTPSLQADVTPQEKILEVSQKTDGSVVVIFEGKDFRISKPELYSESDQFIERLMELTRFDLKELEYDSQKDESVKLTTPLSRLVTRLGFVGVKRDLFFPRTAKQVVLFRKYVTRKDLLDMNLTAAQVLDSLSSPI